MVKAIAQIFIKIKNDFSYLNSGDYDVQIPNAENKKIWGLPYMGPAEPMSLGVFSGITIGALYNYKLKRPPFTSN